MIEPTLAAPVSLFGARAEEPPPNRFSAADIAAVLMRYRLPVSNEAALQSAVEKALRQELGSDAVRREVVRGADRIDFVVGSVGVELKVKGSFAAVLRQLERYSKWEALGSLVLVTAKGAHRALPAEVGGKALVICIVRGVF